MQSKCMSEKESIEEIVKQFEIGGLATVMMTSPKTVRFLGSSYTRQSPRHRGDHPEMETRREAHVTLTPIYLSPKASEAPDL